MITKQEQKIESIRTQIKMTRSYYRKNDLIKQLNEEVKQLKIAKRYLNMRS
jgi:hypothetical protein